MTRHTHTWHYLSTNDDGARLVFEESCETCGKHRRKPYRYEQERINPRLFHALLLGIGIALGILLSVILL